MTVSLLDLKAQNSALAADLQAAFDRVVHSGQFILGPEVERFEAALATWIGTRHALGISSGTDALLLALMAIGVGPGDEVLCPSFTFFATAGCISRLGAKPVFVDSDPLTFNLDPADAARRITSRTKAIVPVHLFGRAAEMDAINALAAKHHLYVIEDAAQSIGAGYRGRRVGTLSDCTAISFFPTKNLGALGDAGAFVTNDDEIFARARILRQHGMEPKYHHAVIGGNFRLDALQAAFLGVKLPHLDRYTAARRAHAAEYDEGLRRLPGVVSAAEEDGARLILPGVNPDSTWNQYTLRVPGAGRRGGLRAHLAAKGIGTEIYYPLPLHEQACFADLGYRAEDLPQAHRLAQEVLSLPVYPEMPAEERMAVVQAITAWLD